MMLSGLAPAKVNLSLRITGRRADGYHLLDSLVVFASVGDRIEVRPSATLALRVDGPFAEGVPEGEENVVMKAARLLQTLPGSGRGAHVRIVKNLPHGAGLGGGSADAAAAIRLLVGLWEMRMPRAQRFASVGADVPVCLHAPVPARMTGIGERVEPVPDLPDAGIVLVHPGVHGATPAIFAEYARSGKAFSDPVGLPPEQLDLPGLATWSRGAGNDLVPAAEALSPEVTAARAALRQEPNVIALGLSGSGSGCWGLTSSERMAREVAASILTKHGEAFWVEAGRVLRPGDRLYERRETT